MITKTNFKFPASGATVNLYTFKNSVGNQIQIIDYGARIVSWIHKNINVITGCENLTDYEKDGGYLGAIVGRCANRIANAEFTLNGKVYNLEKNEGKHHLHGGFNGFDKKFWQGEILGDSLKLTYTSPDGEAGYPAALTATVTYKFTDNDELKIEYALRSDADTVCNLTNHSYFNLDGAGNILNHDVQIFADEYTPANEELIIDGRILPVEGTPLDLRQLTKVSKHMTGNFEYDHNLCIKNFDGEIKKAACVCSEKTGITLTFYTDLPGIQFYTGNFLQEKYSGLCLEAQYFPNAVNIPNFQQPILRAGEILKHQIIYALK